MTCTSCEIHGFPQVDGRTDPEVCFGLAAAHYKDDVLTIQQSVLAARDEESEIRPYSIHQYGRAALVLTSRRDVDRSPLLSEHQFESVPQRCEFPG